jgi:hypothetical protein
MQGSEPIVINWTMVLLLLGAAFLIGAWTRGQPSEVHHHHYPPPVEDTASGCGGMIIAVLAIIGIVALVIWLGSN